MTTKGIIIIIIAILIIVLAGYIYLQSGERPPAPTAKGTQTIVPPAATGKVDDLVAAIMAEITDEELLIKEEEKDTSFISSDSQEVSDFGQTINENEF